MLGEKRSEMIEHNKNAFFVPHQRFGVCLSWPFAVGPSIFPFFPFLFLSHDNFMVDVKKQT